MSQTYDTVLVIGADKLTSIVDWTDRTPACSLAMAPGRPCCSTGPDRTAVLLTVCLGRTAAKVTCCACRWGQPPARLDPFDRRAQPLHPDGRSRDVQERRAGHAGGGQGGAPAVRARGVQIACIIPHQANQRIIEAVADRLGARPEQVFMNLDRYGNTSAGIRRIALRRGGVVRTHPTRRSGPAAGVRGWLHLGCQRSSSGEVGSLTRMPLVISLAHHL